MRYTEAKLSDIGELMLKDIEKNTVKFKPNYDRSSVLQAHDFNRGLSTDIR